VLRPEELGVSIEVEMWCIERGFRGFWRGWRGLSYCEEI